MKRIILFFSAITLAIATNAQRVDVGLNFMLGLPMGNGSFGSTTDEDFGFIFNGKTGLGIGGGIEINYWFNEAINAGIEVGYFSFGENENSNTVFGLLPVPVTSKATAVPIIVKGQYHFLDGAIRPFAGIGIGYLIYNPASSIDLSAGDEPVPIEVTWKQNGFIISPRAGLLFQATDMIAVNLNIQYNLILNKIDGDTDIDAKQGPFEETDNIKGWQSDATNFLGINIGVLFTLFE